MDYWKSITKVLRHYRHYRHAAAASSAASTDSTNTLQRLKLQALFSQKLNREEENDEKNDDDDEEEEALKSMIADIFASIAAIKASYARLQLAQSPYDPHSIQSSDRSIVSILKRISQLKQSYLNDKKNHRKISACSATRPLAAHAIELKHLVSTFQITVRKLESDLQTRDSEIASLRSKLRLDDLHLSGLNPNHFSKSIRPAMKSVRCFAEIMAKNLEDAGWDLNDAAASIHRIALKPEHRSFAFESFVCGVMFSGFQRKDFELEILEHRSRWNRCQFFEEFHESKFLRPTEIADRTIGFGKFCRGKYARLVHPKMEEAVSRSGSGLSGSGFVDGFHEMAKRVWLLHCLFFSFGSELDGSIFRARSGSRFSEVFMESVADEEDPIRASLTVGFTVVPGFKLGSTVVPCKVYLK